MSQVLLPPSSSAVSPRPDARVDEVPAKERVGRLVRPGHEWVDVAAILAICLVVLLSGLLLGNHVAPFADQAALGAAGNVFQAVIPLVAFLACLSAGFATTGRNRWGWWLLGAGAFSWAAGQAVWTFYESVLGESVPFPGWADVGYLGFSVLGAAGLLLFPLIPARAVARGRALLDGGIIASSLLFVNWAIVLGAMYRAGEGTWFEQAIGLAYPLGDVIILTVVLLMLTSAHGRDRLPLVLLAVGLVAFSVADTGFALLNLQGTYSSGHPIDLGWPIGFLLIALAALSRKGVFEAKASTEHPSVAMGALPMIPLVAGVIAASYRVVLDGFLEAFLVWCAATTVLMVSARQLWTIHENEHLNRHLDQALKSKIELLGHISHEMRNPLTPIRLQLHLLRIAGEPLDAGRAKSLRILERNFDRLNLFIQDVLDVARLEAGWLRIVQGPVDLRQLITDAVESVESTCEGKQLTLTSELPPTLWAWGDPQRLSQVLANLVSNAIKFTPQGGSIHVRGCVRRARVVVEVHDEGVGLSPEQMQKLFRPFSRAHESSGIPGLGLGLFICKGLIEQHGGKLIVASAGVGKGATFTFDVPGLPEERLALATAAPAEISNPPG